MSRICKGLALTNPDNQPPGAQLRLLTTNIGDFEIFADTRTESAEYRLVDINAT